MKTKRINLISGPRNISTALMYSFGNRSDTSAVDEPMYAYYLSKTGIHHPGKEEVLKSLPTDLQSVKSKYLFNTVDTNYYFIKNMAHHFIMDDYSFIQDFENIFLIRDPKKLIHSFAKVIKNPTIHDIGLKKEYELYEYLREKGKSPIVIDSNDVLKNSEAALSALCKKINIPFTLEMLHWKAGPKPYDGSWAKYWYANVHKTTGFEKNITKEEELEPRLIPLYEEVLPYYKKLSKGKIQ